MPHSVEFHNKWFTLLLSFRLSPFPLPFHSLLSYPLPSGGGSYFKVVATSRDAGRRIEAPKEPRRVRCGEKGAFLLGRGLERRHLGRGRKF